MTPYFMLDSNELKVHSDFHLVENVYSFIFGPIWTSCLVWQQPCWVRRSLKPLFCSIIYCCNLLNVRNISYFTIVWIFIWTLHFGRVCTSENQRLRFMSKRSRQPVARLILSEALRIRSCELYSAAVRKCGFPFPYNFRSFLIGIELNKAASVSIFL